VCRPAARQRPGLRPGQRHHRQSGCPSRAAVLAREQLVGDLLGHPHLPGLGWWFVIDAPVVAGLLYGPLVHFFAHEPRGHGALEVMSAVAHRGGRIAPQVAAVKALASALCIGGVAQWAGRAPSCRSARHSARPWAGWSRWPNPGCGCRWPAAQPEASRRRSTPPGGGVLRDGNDPG
jgi:hypothetical protein